MILIGFAIGLVNGFLLSVTSQADVDGGVSLRDLAAWLVFGASYIPIALIIWFVASRF